jgi:hypothetical protein
VGKDDVRKVRRGRRGKGRETCVPDGGKEEMKGEKLQAVGLNVGAEAVNLSRIMNSVFEMRQMCYGWGGVACLGASVVVDVDVSERSARDTEATMASQIPV